MASNRGSAIYNIKAVVTQTGLNPATIRAWERRYGLPMPERTEGGHRQYSQRDVDTLKWLISHQEKGMSISHAVELWQSLVEIGEDPLLSREKAEAGAARAITPVLGHQIDELRAAWINACLSFDRESAERVLTRAFALFPPEIVCIELLQKGLVDIGDGWHQGTVTVQQEHFTSTLSEQRLEVLIAATPSPTRQELIIVSTAPGERHTFGSFLLTYFLRRRGYDVIHLGADVPVEDFGPTIDSLQPQLVIVSAQLFHTAASIKEVAQSIQTQGVLLAYGGRAFNLMPDLRQYIPGYFLGETLEDAVAGTADLLSQRLIAQESVTQDEKHRYALAQYRERQSLIESHVWGTFIATNKNSDHLSAINNDIAAAIGAALNLGSIKLLGTDISWIESILMSYHQSSDFIHDYVLAYYQAAKIHLGEAGRIIVDWLATLVTD